jgi:anhydro-N-acetylmuramic acid kinase
MESYKAVGVMSGTSLDGLDIVLCKFSNKDKWSFEILKSETIEYSNEWKNRLSNAPVVTGYDLSILHKEFGYFIGKSINDFLHETEFKVDLIASHGHTVFHQPEKKLTLQIGDGHEIAAVTNILTISDFRSMDVALGGQGAPLVPIGDKLLFNNYDFCVNLGGFANISFEEKGQRLAYDICPANIILNYLANKLNYEYDKNGALGFLGKLDPELLNELNKLEYYKKEHPKSLGKEWLIDTFIPVLEKSELSVKDKIRTVYEHIAQQTASALNIKKQSTAFITGGGVHNKFLVNILKQKTKSEIIIPDKEIIEFKEAIIFALLGILKFENKINCLASVTGALRDSSGGIIHIP